MPISVINGIRIYSEWHGEGAPVVLVHGSWGDHHNWDPVVPGLARTFRTLTYDRRGHSQSERLASQGSIEEHVADLALLITAQHVAPAHIVGNSFGGSIVLKLAAGRPDLFASLTVHEPPLWILPPGGTRAFASSRPPQLVVPGMTTHLVSQIITPRIKTQ